MSIKDPIGFVLAEEKNADKTFPTVMSASFSNYGGNKTIVDRNQFGEICVRDGDRKPKIWKTEAAAQKHADDRNEEVAKRGANGNIGRVIVMPIYRDRWETKDAVIAYFYENPEEIINFIQDNQR